MSDIINDFERAVTISSSDTDILALDVTMDNAEIILDAVLEDGLLKDIPLIGSIAGIAKVYTGIREGFFLKKIILFLNNIKSIDEKNKEEFIKKHLSDDRERTHFYEKLLLVIEKCDDLAKSIIIANLFKAMIYEKIEKEDFLSTIRAIEQINISTLNKFINDDYPKTNSLAGMEHNYVYELLNTGILYSELRIGVIETRLGGSNVPYDFGYAPTLSGTLILKYHDFQV